MAVSQEGFMKKFAIAMCLCSLMAIPSFAKDTKWDGWVSDSKCGAKGANASHEACTKKCVASGEKPVLVTDADGKVVAIDNPDAVKDHLGHHVEVKGSMTDSGSVHVDSVKMLAAR
jgi:hypothetical protein